MNVRVFGSNTMIESDSEDGSEVAMLFLLACDRWLPGAEEMRFLLRGLVMGISIPGALAAEGPSLVLGLPLVFEAVPVACVNHEPDPCVYLLLAVPVLFSSLLIGLEKFRDGLDGSATVVCSSLTFDSLLAGLLAGLGGMLALSTLLPRFPLAGVGLMIRCGGSILALLLWLFGILGTGGASRSNSIASPECCLPGLGLLNVRSVIEPPLLVRWRPPLPTPPRVPLPMTLPLPVDEIDARRCMRLV